MKRIITSVLALLAATAVGVVTTGSPAQAYCKTNYKWTTPSAVKIRATSNVPTAWDSIISASTGQWRGISGSSYAINVMGRNVSGPIYGGGFFRSAVSGGFGGAPAVTLSQHSGNTNIGANTYFDPTFAWYTTGTMNQSLKQADVRTVLVHELGHWLTLVHPNQCGAMTTDEVNASMNPNWKKKWNTNADDKAGSAAMY